VVEVNELLRRIDRLESSDQIRQLASRYGVLLDRRNLDAAAELFVEDVRISRTEAGRAALRELLERLFRQFTTSIHMIGNHTIEFVDDDHAEGVVYCRAEHEYGDQWIIMAIQYWDRYERRHGKWLFTGRQVRHWYAVDVLERPNGPDKTRWTVTGPHTIPDIYESWRNFWSTPAEEHVR
jgi:hypothetical protein